MRISNLLPEKELKEITIIEEHEFDTLGLLESQTDLRLISFLDSPKYIQKIPSNVSMLIITKEILDNISQFNRNYGLVLSENPRILFFQLHNSLKDNLEYKRPLFENYISSDAQISELAVIEDHNVIIESGAIVEPFAYIHANSIIGKNSVIRSGAQIGGVGFEFKRIQNAILPVNHYGGVKIGENVEIQNGSCVDRAIYPWDNTEIGDYSKIDNLVHIGHAAKVKQKVLIAAGAIIGGRTIIKENAWIGIGAILKNGLVIGTNSRANMGAVVTKNVNDGESVTGNFAIPHRDFINALRKGVR